MNETTSAPSLRELSEAATQGEWRMRKHFISAPSTNPVIPGEDVVFSVAYSDRSHDEDNRNLAFAARLVADYRAGRLIDPTTLTEAVASARAEAVAAERERTAPIFAVLEEAAIWHDDQAKALSKQPPGGDRDWRRMEHAEQAEMLRAIPLEAALTPGGRTDG